MDVVVVAVVVVAVVAVVSRLFRQQQLFISQLVITVILQFL